MDAETTAFPLVELGIRGKRSRRVSKSTSAKDKLRKRGRPLKHVFELAITKKRARAEALEAFKQQKSVMTSSEPKYQVSELERLPVELIQQIFLHSLELNLPRASTSLARSLSKESIYSSLLLLAFFDDENWCAVNDASEGGKALFELGYEDVHHGDGGDVAEGVGDGAVV